MKKIAIVLAFLASTTVIASMEDGVQVLGVNPTDAQISMVRAGAKQHCASIDDYEEKEQCAMDYYSQHNFEGEPDCE